jgi:hypothetical protein
MRGIGLVFVAGFLLGCGDDDVARDDAGGGRDAGSADARSADAPGPDAGPADAGSPDYVEWPNPESSATSDPWIVENHERIGRMRPRVLALNFVNARTNAEMITFYEQIFASIREATRFHGAEDPAAPAFLEYEIAYAVDLRDDPPPKGWVLRNSSIYPREDPVDGDWGFDYERLFHEDFARRYGIADPDAPGEVLDLCELSERGLVHEVWIYGDADVPDVSAAEILGLMPAYSAGLERGARLDGCAGNGCFDAEDTIPASCTRTLRIGWVNHTRGVGCYMESLSHGIERIGNGGLIPYFRRQFRPFAGFDLDTRYGLPFDSWYACDGTRCLTYPTPTSVQWSTAGMSGTIDPYLAVCGNAHFPPNAREHYDVENRDDTVMTTCRTYRQGDVPQPVTSETWSRYRSLAPDCTGAWIVWWWQSFPGLGNHAVDDDGATMRNWWPFLFY